MQRLMYALAAAVLTLPWGNRAWSHSREHDCININEKGWALEHTLYEQHYDCGTIASVTQEFTNLKQRIHSSGLSEHSQEQLIRLVRDSFVPAGKGFTGVLESPQALKELQDCFVTSDDPVVLGATADAAQFIASFNRLSETQWKTGMGLQWLRSYTVTSYPAAEIAFRWLVLIHNKNNRDLRARIDSMLKNSSSEQIPSLAKSFEDMKTTLFQH